MDEAALQRLARKQYGLVTISQLRALGLSTAGVSARAAAGRLTRVHRGVYLVGQAPLGAHGRWLAAVMAGGRGAVLDRWHAASLWTLTRVPSTSVTVATRDRGRKGNARVRVHRVRTLPPEDRTIHEGIPVTTVARTLVDLAGVASQAALERLLHEAEVRRLLDIAAVDACVERLGAPRGVRLLRAALAGYAAGRIRSDLEERFASLLLRSGVPRPRRNAHVDVGARLVEVDALWPAQRLVVELDGRGAHHTRRAFEGDRRKDAALQVAGYRVLRLTDERLAREPDTILGELWSLLQTRAAH